VQGPRAEGDDARVTSALVLAVDAPLTAVATGHGRVVVGDERGRLHVGTRDDAGAWTFRAFVAHDGAVRAVCIVDDARVASGGEDDAAVVWALREEAWRAVARVQHRDFVRALCVLEHPCVDASAADASAADASAADDSAADDSAADDSAADDHGRGAGRALLVSAGYDARLRTTALTRAAAPDG
jgi:hypothetical protein